MNKLLIASLLVAIALTQTTCPTGQFLYNSVCVSTSCPTYLSRIGTTAAGANGNGTVPLNTQGTIQNLNGNVVVTFQFKDTQNDGTFNRDNTLSCLSSELIRTTQGYTPVAYNETTITSSYDAASGYRNWSFTITPTQYAQLTIANVNGTSGITTYNGYFAYRFNMSTITQYTYYFTFSFGVNTATGASTGLAQFQPLMTYAVQACSTPNNCVATISTTVGFTTSLSTAGCATASASPSTNLPLNSNVFICVSVSNTGFGAWKLANPTITLVGTGLNYAVPFTSSAANTVTAAGVAVYTFQVPFAYKDVKITVTNTAVAPSRRLLADSTIVGTPSTGTSQTVSMGSAYLAVFLALLALLF